ETAIMLEPNRVETHANLGKLYQALGRTDEAHGAFRTAARLDPSFTPGVEGLFDQARMLCAWDELDEIGTLYGAALRRVANGQTPAQAGPFTALSVPLPHLVQKVLTERIGEAISAPFSAAGGLPPPRA